MWVPCPLWYLCVVDVPLDSCANCTGLLGRVGGVKKDSSQGYFCNPRKQKFNWNVEEVRWTIHSEVIPVSWDSGALVLPLVAKCYHCFWRPGNTGCSCAFCGQPVIATSYTGNCIQLIIFISRISHGMVFLGGGHAWYVYPKIGWNWMWICSIYVKLIMSFTGLVYCIRLRLWKQWSVRDFREHLDKGFSLVLCSSRMLFKENFGRNSIICKAEKVALFWENWLVRAWSQPPVLCLIRCCSLNGSFLEQSLTFFRPSFFLPFSFSGEVSVKEHWGGQKKQLLD